jgi:hypothetical protein
MTANFVNSHNTNLITVFLCTLIWKIIRSLESLQSSIGNYFTKFVLLHRGNMYFCYYHNFGIILNDQLITDLRSFKLSILKTIKGGIPFLFKMDKWFKSQHWPKQLHRGVGSMATVWTYVRPTKDELQAKRTPQYESVFLNTQKTRMSNTLK